MQNPFYVPSLMYHARQPHVLSAVFLSVAVHFLVLLTLISIRLNDCKTRKSDSVLFVTMSEPLDNDPLITIAPILVEMEVQQELVEVEVPQINLQLSIDEIAGAAGSYTLEQVKPVGSLAIKNGLFTIDTETGSGQSKRRSGKSAGGVGRYSEQFELITQRLRRGLELVIVFDSTGSMGPEIQALKANLIQLGNATLRTLPETRIAFITYKDIGDVPEVAYSPLTNNLFSLASFKVIIVFGDAPPRRKDLHAILLLCC